MNGSIDKWTEQLRSRFKANASSALKQADRMEHRFADESILDVRQYITKKAQLYNEAGEENEDLIVRRLHDGLDPTLAAAVPLRSNNNTFFSFARKVYSAESAARAQFLQYEQMTKATRLY